MIRRTNAGMIAMIFLSIVFTIPACGQETGLGLDAFESSPDDMRARLDVRLRTDAPELYQMDLKEFSNLVETLSGYDRPGWAENRMVSWANRCPETNAVVVFGWDSGRRRPTSTWEMRYSDEEVSEGRQKNQVSRLVFLRFALGAIHGETAGIPASEILRAFNGLWADDLLDRAWGRGFNSMQFHRERDGMDSPRWFYEWLASSPLVDITTRMESLSYLSMVVSSPEEQSKCKAAIIELSALRPGNPGQRGDPSAAPFATGLKAADEAEREAERERRLRMEAPPATLPRTNAEPILVHVKVRRNRNPSSTTNAPPAERDAAAPNLPHEEKDNEKGN